MLEYKMKSGFTLLVGDPATEEPMQIGLRSPDGDELGSDIADLDELNDIVFIIANGELPPRCIHCGCVQDRACVLVGPDGVVLGTCGWSSTDPCVCTACDKDELKTALRNGGVWKHPAELTAWWRRLKRARLNVEISYLEGLDEGLRLGLKPPLRPDPSQ